MSYSRMFRLVSITLLMFFNSCSKKPVNPDTPMVLVPAGPYDMGATSSGYTQPVHTINIPAFYIDIYEVTNAQYKAFCDATSRKYPPDPEYFFEPNYLKRLLCTIRIRRSRYLNYFTNSTYANYPVVNISWEDAHAYAAWVGKRLPTEAEWERAALGNLDNRQWPWGDNPMSFERKPGLMRKWIASYANLNDNYEPADGYEYTSPVGNYPKGISPVGCYDMEGNVGEWCEDDWHNNYNGVPTDGSAWVDNSRLEDHVCRGSSWGEDPTSFPSASHCRNRYRGLQYYWTGFRCARTP